MSTIKCPVCAGEVNASDERCRTCGYSMLGNTEKIDYVGADEEGMVAAPCGGNGKARLTLTKGPLKGEVFYLESFPVSIGREPSCDIFLNNMTVSREHAKILNLDGQLIVEDQDSLNGTWVDSKIVESAELYEGSLLQIGTFSMRFSCS